MEVALTFGSLGDIIAICQLAVQLSRALGLGCTAVGGSAKEYQGLREDLSLFVQMLLHVCLPSPSTIPISEIQLTEVCTGRGDVPRA